MLPISPLALREPLEPGFRSFEIFCGRNEDKFPVPPAVPTDWGADVRALWEQRIEWLRRSPQLQLIEDAHYKRRWMGRQGLFNHTRDSDEMTGACTGSGCFSASRATSTSMAECTKPNRLPRAASCEIRLLLSAAKVADLARNDKDFMRVAEIFTGRIDFDVGALVSELVTIDSVPALPALRYKPAALDKRRAWERTWEFQRLEDAVDALFNVEPPTEDRVGQGRGSPATARDGIAD